MFKVLACFSHRVAVINRTNSLIEDDGRPGRPISVSIPENINVCKMNSQIPIWILIKNEQKWKRRSSPSLELTKMQTSSTVLLWMKADFLFITQRQQNSGWNECTVILPGVTNFMWRNVLQLFVITMKNYGKLFWRSNNSFFIENITRKH